MSQETLQEFRKILAKIAPLNDAEWEYLANDLEVLKFKRDELIHTAGNKVEHLYFIVTGTVRKFSIKAGIEVTNNVYSNQRFVTDLLSVSEKKPSIYSFECLCDTTIVKLSIANSEKAFSISPKFSTLARVMYQQAFLQESLRLREVLTAQPIDQYIRFTKEHKELCKYLPQNKIAQCLNMAPESLSRIRKKLLT